MDLIYYDHQFSSLCLVLITILFRPKNNIKWYIMCIPLVFESKESWCEELLPKNLVECPT